MRQIELTIQEFAEFCQGYLKMNQMPRIIVVHTVNFPEMAGTFGQYNPLSGEFRIAVANRHTMDILRTVAHELVHHKQTELNSTRSRAEKEYEANTYGGMLIKLFGVKCPHFFSNN
jgi:hypothetical protein